MIYNKYVNTLLYLLLIIYITIIAPRLKKKIIYIFNSKIIKIIILLIIIFFAYIGEYTLALLLSLSYMESMFTLHKYNINELLQNTVMYVKSEQFKNINFIENFEPHYNVSSCSSKYNYQNIKTDDEIHDELLQLEFEKFNKKLL